MLRREDPMIALRSRTRRSRAHGRVRALAALATVAALLAAPVRAAAPAAPAVSAVDVISVTGVISPIVLDQVDDAIAHATAERRAGLVIEVDTPGGLDVSMRSIVHSILASRVPVLVYV